MSLFLLVEYFVETKKHLSRNPLKRHNVANPQSLFKRSADNLPQVLPE